MYFLWNASLLSFSASKQLQFSLTSHANSLCFNIVQNKTASVFTRAELRQGGLTIPLGSSIFFHFLENLWFLRMKLRSSQLFSIQKPFFVTFATSPAFGLPCYIPPSWCFLDAVTLPSVSAEPVYGGPRGLGRLGLVPSRYSPGPKWCVAWQQQFPVEVGARFFGQPALTEK